jgi:transcriptional regulator with XRE-family HTH domain
MNRVVRAAMDAAGITAEDLAEAVGADPKTAARWATEGRIPQTRYRAKVAELLRRDIQELWPDITRKREPAWFREWREVEREAVALRSYEMGWVPGLFQTAAYAEAVFRICGMRRRSEIEAAVAARLARAEILHGEEAPLVVSEQLAHLAECAQMPDVQVYVVPSNVLHAGVGGAFWVAELRDGSRIAVADGQLEAKITAEPGDLATLEARWDLIRGEALSRQQSLDLIKDAASSWT